MMNEAKEERELRKDFGNAIWNSSSSFNEAIQSISSCITGLANSSTKSMEMLSHAMANSHHNQPQPVHQNLLYPPQKQYQQKQFSWRNAMSEGNMQKPYEWN